MTDFYYEDLEAGMEFATATRTVTETDLTMFAMFSGDWNPIHVDATRSENQLLGKRVVHGVAGLVVMNGLIYASGWFGNTTAAVIGYEQWNFRQPIYIGDTLSCRLTILGKRVSSKGLPIVQRQQTIYNQDEVVVQEGKCALVMRRRNDGE